MCQLPNIERNAKCTGLIWAGRKIRPRSTSPKVYIVTLVSPKSEPSALNISQLSQGSVVLRMCCHAPAATDVRASKKKLCSLQSCCVPHWFTLGKHATGGQGKERKQAGWAPAARWRFETQTVASEGISC
jgi:hypothetical protein